MNKNANSADVRRLTKESWKVFRQCYICWYSLFIFIWPFDSTKTPKLRLTGEAYPSIPKFENHVKYRVSHIEMVETKWLWGVAELRILINYGAQGLQEAMIFVFHQPAFKKVT